ncbi:MAG: hypothetical protein NVS9B10_25480 [Nevskia sp.]
MKKLFRTRLLLALAAALASGCSDARQPPAGGDFDYYVLSLSWSPEYCAETRREHEPQCARPYAFVAHGLWPQNERGYPKDCRTRERVEDDTIGRLLPIMPSRGLIIHEWRAHGACSGLGADAYFSTVERAWRSVRIPPRYTDIGDYLSVDAAQLKRDVIASNPQIPADGLVLECSGHYLQEIRICLDRQLRPRGGGGGASRAAASRARRATTP